MSCHSRNQGGITPTPLHVITGAVCNAGEPITGCNYGSAAVTTPRQALQIEPVITCNGPDVIGPLDMTDSDQPDLAYTQDIESISSYSGFSGPHVDEQTAVGAVRVTVASVMTRTERLWRLRAELRARTPYVCPHCGSGGPVPAFVRGADVWICASWRCGRWFVAVD